MGLTIQDLLASGAAVTKPMHQQAPWRAASVVALRLGLLLGTIHIVNHSLEVCANLPPPLPAIRGVAMWAVIFLTCGAASTRVVERSGSVLFGTAASVLAACGGATILVVFAVGVGVVRGEPLAAATIASTGGMHIGGSVAVGAVIGGISGWIAAALARASRTTALIVAVGSVLLLAAGLLAIAHATGLDRALRPPFIMFGLPAVAIALAVAAPACWALTRTVRQPVG